jgi:hypothetical protein
MDTKIKASFWDDEAVGRLAEEGDHPALVSLLWLMTASVNSAGWTEISARKFHFQTGCNPLALAKACQALGDSVVALGKGIWLRHYIRHQLGTGPSMAANNMAAGVVRALRDTPPEIVKEVLHQYPELKPRACQALGKGAKAQDRIGSDRIGSEEAEKGAVVLPPEWSDARRAAVEEFMAFRRSIRKPMKPASFPAWVKKFAAVDDATLAATIQESIANGWQGVFPDRLTHPHAGVFRGQKKEGGAATSPAVNPYEVPPCADWKQIARRLAAALGLEEAEINDDLSWKDISGAARLAVWAEFKKERGGS